MDIVIEDIARRLKKEAYIMSRCKKRKVGCAIIIEKKNTSIKTILSRFNGPSENLLGCVSCLRKNELPGEKNYLCRGTHAEMLAILDYCRYGLPGSEGNGEVSLVVTLFPCIDCTKAIIEIDAIKTVYYVEEYYKVEKKEYILELFRQAGIRICKIGV